jgi:hypothetical protein
LHRPLLDPSGEECFTRTVLTANRFEDGSAGGHSVEVFVDGGGEAIDTDSEDIEVAVRHGALA